MRLGELLSKFPEMTSAQIEGFLDDRPLGWGKHKRVRAGKVLHNFHCRKCDDQRTFESAEDLYCLGLGRQSLSVDATLRCPGCNSTVELWFLLGSDDDISGRAPQLRLEKYTENLRDAAYRVGSTTGQFGDLVKRAQVAYEADLGAGSMIYLRKILESITFEVADIAGIARAKPNGRRRSFYEILQEVNQQRRIIPQRFSSNGYQLFSELSEAIHGDSSEADALKKYKACLLLVLGVVEEVQRDNVFGKAIDALGWEVDALEEMASDEVNS